MTLETGKCDVFTEDSFGEMEVIQTTETGNYPDVIYLMSPY